MTLFLLFVILGGAHCIESLSFLQEGSCAPFSLMDGFQMDQYVGRWYTLLQVPSGYLTLTKCVTDFLSLTDDGLQVTTSGRTSQGNLGSSQAALVYDNATAEDGRPFLQLNAPFVPPVPYYVVYTDYVQVSCVYSCKGLLHVKGEVFWVLSRKKSIEPRLLQLCLQTFSCKGLDVDRLQHVDQEGCEGTSSSNEDFIEVEGDLRNPKEGILTPDEGVLLSDDYVPLRKSDKEKVLLQPRPTHLETSSKPDEESQVLLALAKQDPGAAGNAYSGLPPDMTLLFLVALWLTRMA